MDGEKWGNINCASVDKPHAMQKSPIRKKSLIVLAAVVLHASCKHPVPGYCDEDTPCPPGEWCDLKGEYEASEFIGNTCIPSPFDAGVSDANPPDAGPPCSDPDAFLSCEGDVAVTCSPSGQEERETCAFGCNAAEERCNECEPSTTECMDESLVTCTGDGEVEESTACGAGCVTAESRCAEVVPSNDLLQYLRLAKDGPNVSLTDGAIINTDDGTVTDGGGGAVLAASYEISAPTDGVPIRVFVVRTFDAGNVNVVGTSALAIVSHGDITLGGSFDVSAAPGKKGPGAIQSASEACAGEFGGSATVQGKQQFGGTGGGGYRTGGGEGGAVTNAIVGGSGGAAFANDDLVPLRGGCGGFGDGGGAVQLVSSTRILLQGGVVSANGRGGSGGSGPDSQGGGGSGGAILLEAPVVNLSGAAGLYSNGGGGASKNGTGPAGSNSTSAVAGTACDGSICGSGGDGGAISRSPTNGQSVALDASHNYQWGGGGGGSAGYIRVNTLDGTVNGLGSNASPQVTTGTLETQ